MSSAAISIQVIPTYQIVSRNCSLNVRSRDPIVTRNSKTSSNLCVQSLLFILNIVNKYSTIVDASSIKVSLLYLWNNAVLSKAQ